MSKPHRMCVNCSTVYPDRLRKCPTRGCRAPKRFSCAEPEEHLRIRAEIEAAQEAFLQQLAAAHDARVGA